MNFIFYKSLTKLGGAEVFLVEFANELVKNDKVTIVCYEYDSRLGNQLKIDKNISIKIINGHWIHRIYRTSSFLLKNRCDCLLVHSGFIDVLFINLLIKVPYVLWLHQPYFNTLLHNKIFALIYKRHLSKFLSDEFSGPILKDLAKKINLPKKIKLNISAVLEFLCFKRAKDIIVLSEYSQKEKEIYFKVKSRVLPAAISNTFLKHLGNPNNHKNYILFFGRLIKQKRIELVCESYLSAGISEDLYIIGDGPMFELLRSRYNSPKIKIFRDCDFDDLITYIKESKFVITLDWADFNLTVYESITLGKRVIYGDNFGIQEFDKKFIETGMLHYVKPNVESVSKKIKELTNLSQPSLNNYEFIKEYNWSWYIKNFKTYS